MSWIFLLIAGLLEVLWAFTMKQSEGFTRAALTIVTLVAMAASFWLLSFSMKTLPLGTAYMVWTGIGAIGAFILGIAVLGDPLGAVRLLAGGRIVSGLLLMKLASLH